jgi:hypothetical protein
MSGTRMTWFEELTGFREASAEAVRAQITLDGTTMTSRANGRTMTCGQLEQPTLRELRLRVHDMTSGTGRLRLREVVADVQSLHEATENAGAMFQVASQFNLLEMVAPSVTPEAGVGIYENDRTQGPACAVACGAGTIYRNYFVEIGGEVGQSASRQIDCLRDVGRALDNRNNRLWVMRNGYALASTEGLAEIQQRLLSMDDSERDELRAGLRIGLQWDTEVTLNQERQTVSQAYCSALPVAYSAYPATAWAEFAKLVLEASYEATLCAAVLNADRTGCDRIFLTLLGGGAFGNDEAWIAGAIQQALRRFVDRDLDVAIVSYGSSSWLVRNLVADWADEAGRA